MRELAIHDVTMVGDFTTEIKLLFEKAESPFRTDSLRSGALFRDATATGLPPSVNGLCHENILIDRHCSAPLINIHVFAG